MFTTVARRAWGCLLLGQREGLLCPREASNGARVQPQDGNRDEDGGGQGT